MWIFVSFISHLPIAPDLCCSLGLRGHQKITDVFGTLIVFSCPNKFCQDLFLHLFIFILPNMSLYHHTFHSCFSVYSFSGRHQLIALPFSIYSLQFISFLFYTLILDEFAYYDSSRIITVDLQAQVWSEEYIKGRVWERDRKRSSSTVPEWSW